MNLSIKEVVYRYGVYPSKRKGQAFLVDRNIIRKIVDAAGIHPKDTVIEIGAGLGLMTKIIAQKAGRVVALEVDSHFCEILREQLADCTNVEIIEADVLKYNFSEVVASKQNNKVRIIGNIPYNISTPILFHLLSFRNIIKDMIIMVQREVAARIMAQPGTKTYGIPSVIFSMFTEIYQVCSVSPESFYPVPKVHSSVLHFTYRSEPLYPLRSTDFFVNTIRKAFAKRRKTLLNNFFDLDLSLDADEVIRMAGIDPQRRAETVSAEEFAILSNILFGLKGRKFLDNT
jgi:16S rRNA (adenine1518-N6/adenine1519-N6)-dimethyltransferase